MIDFFQMYVLVWYRWIMAFIDSQAEIPRSLPCESFSLAPPVLCTHRPYPPPQKQLLMRKILWICTVWKLEDPKGDEPIAGQTPGMTCHATKLQSAEFERETQRLLSDQGVFLTNGTWLKKTLNCYLCRKQHSLKNHVLSHISMVFHAWRTMCSLL